MNCVRVCLLWLFAFSGALQGNGTLNFANGAAGVDSPVLVAGEPTYLGDYRVQLILPGSDETGRDTSISASFVPEAPGYFFGGLVTLPGTEPGEELTVRLRIFHMGGVEEVFSPELTVTLGGGPLPPANLVGLSSMSIPIHQSVRLGVERQDGEVILHWAGQIVGVLEVSKAVAPALWSPVEQSPTLRNDRWEVRIQAGNAQHFYRLRIAL